MKHNASTGMPFVGTRCYRLAFQLSTTPSFTTAGSQSWYESYGSVTDCLLQECQNPTKFKYVE